jgi:Domain of unknown function (DUF4382)/Domain of unknown function (DUF5666)
MRKQLFTLVLAGLVLALAGCGNKTSTSVTSGQFAGGTGSVVILAGDTPQCDVSSFKVTITGITLTPLGGGTPVSILSSAQAMTVEWASLQDLTTLLGSATVPTGTYSTVTLTMADPQLTGVDFTKSPVVPATVAASLSSLKVSFSIVPALTVASDKTVGLKLDFDLLNSLGLDKNGNLSGKVAPIFAASPVVLTTSSSSGELENLHGLVQSFSTTASGTFSGSLVLGTDGAGGSVKVNVDDSTELLGVASLGEILVGTFVEIDAFVDPDGNVVASRITSEDQENAATQRAAFIGQVVSVNRLGTGAVSDFTIIVHEEFPDVSADVPLNALQVVTVLSTANFSIAAPSANHAGLGFDATTLGVGQDVVVHGQFLPGAPAVVNTNSIYLRLQTVAGNFSSVLAKATNDKTGGFAFAPCSGVFQGGSLAGLTSTATSFVNVAGLSRLRTTPTLFVKGLVFFEPTLTSSGTVTLSPPSTVLVADSVHELP